MPAKREYRTDLICGDCGHFPKDCQCVGGLLRKYWNRKEIWMRFPPDQIPSDEEMDRLVNPAPCCEPKSKSLRPNLVSRGDCCW